MILVGVSSLLPSVISSGLGEKGYLRRTGERTCPKFFFVDSGPDLYEGKREILQRKGKSSLRPGEVWETKESLPLLALPKGKQMILWKGRWRGKGGKPPAL